MNSTKHLTERRKHRRYQRQMDLALKSASGEDLAVRTINISRSGAYCESPVAIPVMTRLHVRIELPGPGRSACVDCVECGGVVVRSEEKPGDKAPDARPYRLAIFFDRMSEVAAARFARFLEPDASGEGIGVELPLEE